MQHYLDPTIQEYTEAFTRLHAGADLSEECAWLSDMQIKALSTFQSMGFPHRKTEDWKYTKLDAFLAQDFTPVSTLPENQTINATQLVPYIIEPDCFCIVLRNGIVDESLCSLDNLPEGVTVLPLSVALRKQASLVKPYLEKSAQVYTHAFSALNMAMLKHGVFIRLAENVQLTKPIQICHIGFAALQSPANHTRTLVVAGKNSQAQLIESYFSFTDVCYFTNTTTDIHLAENAFVEHVKIQSESPSAYHVGTLNGFQDRDSTLQSYSLSFGGKWVRSDSNIALKALGACCRLDGVFMATDTQHIDHHTRLDHHQPHGDSDQHYRGILNGKATGVFNGKVIVHEGAQKSNAHMQNKNILLSPGAQMNTKPDLEIFADDVKCSHGATVGQLDDKQLFYLQARGLPYHEAQYLLTFAFASAIINRLPSPALSQYAQSQLLAKMPNGEVLKELLS